MIDLDNLCMGCMGDKEGQDVCPHCGYDSAQAQQLPICLPQKTLLQNKYVVGKMLDGNGEGFGYLGYDTVSGTPVYVREFLPENLAARASGGVEVKIIPGCEIIFNEYRTAFLEYSRAVARMRGLSAIVPIYDIFEENNTAYTISEWTDHISLEEFVQRSGGKVDWNAARPLFMPVLSSLSALHSGNVMHLGISPDNLVILRSGKMLLKGFSIAAVRQADTDIKPELYGGCSAIEQYVMDYKPDESTDVYGFTACLFYTLTGTMPQDARKRKIDGRLLIPTSILKTIPPHVVTALANALQVMPNKRTATFERLRAELSAAPTVTMVAKEVAAPPQKSPSVQKAAKKTKKKVNGIPDFLVGVISCVIALVVLGTIGILYLNMKDHNSGLTSTADVSSAASLASTASSVAANQSDKLMDVPDLSGKNYEDEKKSAQTQGLYQVLLSSEEFNSSVKEGCIISQTPAVGSGKMSRGSVIAVVVSKGSEMRKLPDISGGLSLAEASAKIAKEGLKPVQVDGYSNTVPQGKVIGYKQNSAGDTVKYASEVEIVVSQGKAPSSTNSAG